MAPGIIACDQDSAVGGEYSNVVTEVVDCRSDVVIVLSFRL